VHFRYHFDSRLLFPIVLGVHLCACVKERERERKKERERYPEISWQPERERARENERASVCERERQSV